MFHEKMSRFFCNVDGDPAEWEQIGNHAAALALGSGLLKAENSRAACTEYVKKYILNYFPSHADAPRLYGATVEADQLITLFFMHHVLLLLIENGEMDFVLEHSVVCFADCSAFAGRPL